MDIQVTDKFFAILRYAIGTGVNIPDLSFSDIEKIHEIAKKQSLLGVLFPALEKSGIRPTDIDKKENAFEGLLMPWMGEKVKISRQNEKINQDVAEVVSRMNESGYETCLLKGQGNALLYPDQFSRTPGDIDLWTRLKKSAPLKESSKALISFANKNGKKSSKAVYHHVDGLQWNGTEIELHYRPQFLQNFIHNSRLQKFFIDNADEQFHHFVKMGSGKVAIPVPTFNIVFQLSHIYIHLFQEGIGLRQILDYYYVLKSYADDKTKDSTNWDMLLDYLGLQNIAIAIMWILEEELGMPGEWAIVPPDEKRGRFVLNEILRGGNFGKYDERNRRFGQSRIGRNVQRLVRDFRLVRYFPSEALSEPFFRLWHAVWRWRHN